VCDERGGKKKEKIVNAPIAIKQQKNDINGYKK
jgi:hypothetical protein